MRGQSLTHLREGPGDCPLCEGPCKEPLERGEYVFGGPMELHPMNREKREREAERKRLLKRPKGKRRPAEDRARHLAEDR